MAIVEPPQAPEEHLDGNSDDGRGVVGQEVSHEFARLQKLVGDRVEFESGSVTMSGEEQKQFDQDLKAGIQELYNSGQTHLEDVHALVEALFSRVLERRGDKEAGSFMRPLENNNGTIGDEQADAA